MRIVLICWCVDTFLSFVVNMEGRTQFHLGNFWLHWFFGGMITIFRDYYLVTINILFYWWDRLYIVIHFRLAWRASVFDWLRRLYIMANLFCCWRAILRALVQLLFSFRMLIEFFMVHRLFTRSLLNLKPIIWVLKCRSPVVRAILII